MSEKKNDLGLKIASSPEEALWTNVLKQAEGQLKANQESIMIQKEIIILAKRKIEEAKRKAKV